MKTFFLIVFLFLSTSVCSATTIEFGTSQNKDLTCSAFARICEDNACSKWNQISKKFKTCFEANEFIDSVVSRIENEEKKQRKPIKNCLI